MSVTLGFNFSQFTTDTLNLFSIQTAINGSGFNTLTLTTTNALSEVKTFNIFQDISSNPKVNINGNVYPFQNDVSISPISDLASASLMAVSTDGNPCALRISTNATGTPRVIFSGSTSGSVNSSAKVAYLSDAFNVFNESTTSIAYAGTFIFALPSLDNSDACTIQGGLASSTFTFSTSQAGRIGSSFTMTIAPKTNVVVDGLFTFSNILTIDYNDGSAPLVYDVTSNLQFMFAQLSALTAVNSTEYTYDISNAVSSSATDGSFDGFRLQLSTGDDAITIGDNTWNSNPYDSIIDFGGISRNARKRVRANFKRIKEFDQLSTDLENAKIRADILKNYRF
jgi:hypothetical protein